LDADPNATINPYAESSWLVEDDLDDLNIPKRATVYEFVDPSEKKTPKAATKQAKATRKNTSPIKQQAAGGKRNPQKKEGSWGARKVDASRRIHDADPDDADKEGEEDDEPPAIAAVGHAACPHNDPATDDDLDNQQPDNVRICNTCDI
jgi:hypothetical protein